MKLFAPVTSKGEKVTLPRYYLSYKINWVWPLADDSPKYQNFIATSLAWIFLLCYGGTIFGEILFIRQHKGEFTSVAECFCTTFIGTQFSIRILNLLFSRDRMKEVLRKFYARIFVDKSENEELHAEVNRSLRFVNGMAFGYLVTLFFMFLAVGVAIARDPSSLSKPYLYRMQFSYDAQEPWRYAFTTMYTGWVGVSCVSLMGGQDIFIASTLRYCAVRYEMLHKELAAMFESSCKAVQKSDPNKPNALHDIFTRKLKAVIKKQQLIDSFTKDLQGVLSVFVFIWMTFGTFLLCVVAFQLAKSEFSVAILQYYSWLFSQSTEFLLIGSFGQRFTDAAAQMSNAYYMCNWESVLPHGDSRTNAKLIKDISFAIYRSQKTVQINGMKFTVLSLNSIGSALSTSVSYFMFLTTMEDITNKKSGMA